MAWVHVSLRTIGPEEGGHVSYDAIAVHVPMRFLYGDLCTKSSMMPENGTLPHCDDLDGHIIQKPSFQISTHLNPTPMSLFQYSALNGVYSD